MAIPSFDPFIVSQRFVDHNVTPNHHNASLAISAPKWAKTMSMGVWLHLTAKQVFIIPLYTLQKDRQAQLDPFKVFQMCVNHDAKP